MRRKIAAVKRPTQSG